MEAAAAKRRELEWDHEVERRGAEPQSTDKIGASEEELSRETTPDFWPISTFRQAQVVCFQPSNSHLANVLLVPGNRHDRRGEIDSSNTLAIFPKLGRVVVAPT